MGVEILNTCEDIGGHTTEFATINVDLKQKAAAGGLSLSKPGGGLWQANVHCGPQP